MADTTRKATRKVGRPVGSGRKGLKPGEAVREYGTLTVTCPDDMKAQLKALALVRGEAAWRLIWRLIAADVKRLSGAERGAYRTLLKGLQPR